MCGLQDKHASDSMEELLHVMQVNRLIRAAVGLVKGVELQQTGDSFQIAVLSGILWFKVWGCHGLHCVHGNIGKVGKWHTGALLLQSLGNPRILRTTEAMQVSASRS